MSLPPAPAGPVNQPGFLPGSVYRFEGREPGFLWPPGGFGELGKDGLRAFGRPGREGNGELPGAFGRLQAERLLGQNEEAVNRKPEGRL